MKVTIYPEKFCGSGQCVMNAPAVFDQRDEDGIVVLLHAYPPAEQHANVRRSAQICPALAIRVDEDPQ